MGSTPTYGLRFPELGDPPDGPGQLEALALDTEAELVTVNDRVGAGMRFQQDTGFAAFVVSGRIEIRDTSNGVVNMTGYVDVDTDIGGDWNDLLVNVPVSLRPDLSGGGSVIVFVSNYYNSNAQFRFRVNATTGNLEFQQSGVDGTFATVVASWMKAEA